MMRISGTFLGHAYIAESCAYQRTAVDIVNPDRTRHYAFEMADTLARDWAEGTRKLVHSWIIGADRMERAA